MSKKPTEFQRTTKCLISRANVFFPKFYKSSVVKETCLKITSLAQLILCTPVYFNFFKTGMTCRVVFKSPSSAAAAAPAAAVGYWLPLPPGSDIDYVTLYVVQMHWSSYGAKHGAGPLEGQTIWWVKYSRVWNKRSSLNKHSPWKIWQKE